MIIGHLADTDVVRALAESASLELTPAAVRAAPDLSAQLAAGTSVHVPYLPRADFDDTIDACVHLAAAGMRPIPHLAARSLRSVAELDDRIARLADTGADALFLVAGDVRRPRGPFADTLQVLDSGLLLKRGFTKIGVAGHPEGHPQVSSDALFRALAHKQDYARDTGTEMWLVTQFAFSAAPLIEWLDSLPGAGIQLPVRLGLPGPAKLRTLLNYAVRCGVAASAKAITRHPDVVMRLASTWQPSELLADLAHYARSTPGGPLTGIHLFPFGGLTATAGWLDDWRGIETNTTAAPESDTAVSNA